MRKVKEAQKNENNQSAKTALSQLSVSFFQNNNMLVFNPVQVLIDQDDAYPHYSYCYISQYMMSIFKPPKFRA